MAAAGVTRRMIALFRISVFLNRNTVVPVIIRPLDN